MDVLEAVDNGRDFSQQHVGTVGMGDHDDLRELVAPIGLAHGSKQDFSRRGLDRPPR